MLKVDNVSKIRDGFCLDDISFEIPPGYICGLVGENGAGKTTLINMICGLYSHDTGNIRINGMDIHEMNNEVRNITGTVLSRDMFEAYLSLNENGKRFGRFFRNYDHSKLKEYMMRFELDPSKKYSGISKGEKLKFALAFALSYSPVLLILDEPAANFDPEFREEFNSVLRDFTSDGKRSVLLSTHIMQDAEKYSDYLLMLRKGKQLLFGDIETVRGKYRVAAGDERLLRMMRDRVVSVIKESSGYTALVKNYGSFDPSLKIWEPGIEELMCYFSSEEKL